jgi:predicted Zn-dependent protease
MIHRFAIRIANRSNLTAPVADVLHEAGCDDASLCGHGKMLFAHFDREAESLADAVGSAIRDVERAGIAVEAIVIDRQRQP